jgi:hypothetical protein
LACGFRHQDADNTARVPGAILKEQRSSASASHSKADNDIFTNWASLDLSLGQQFFEVFVYATRAWASAR